MKRFKTTALLCLSFILSLNKSYSGNINPLITNSPLSVEQLTVRLYAYDSDSTSYLYDGALTLYSPTYCNCVNWLEDAQKMMNFTENFSIVRDTKIIAIEKRQPIVSTDTTFFNMTQMRQKTYRLDFGTVNFTQTNLVAYLQDSYTGTSTPVDLTGNTTPYLFTITSNPASANSRRFRLVFSSLSLSASIVPVTYSSVKAWQQNNTIAVQWKVENESNVVKYEIEHSSNGVEFSYTGTIASSGIKSGSTYNWTDINPLAGDNFYRIKTVSSNEQVQYSKVLKVIIGSMNNGISVYPNPVKGNIIGLQINSQTSGNYRVRLLNNSGQVLLSNSIDHKAGNAAESISVNKNIGTGIYRLEVIHPDESISNINVAF